MLKGIAIWNCKLHGTPPRSNLQHACQHFARRVCNLKILTCKVGRLKHITHKHIRNTILAIWIQGFLRDAEIQKLKQFQAASHISVQMHGCACVRAPVQEFGSSGSKQGWSGIAGQGCPASTHHSACHYAWAFCVPPSYCLLDAFFRAPFVE